MRSSLGQPTLLWYVLPYTDWGVREPMLVQAVVSVVYCLKRRIAVHRRLQRISKTYRTLGRPDLPEVGYLSCLDTARPSWTLQRVHRFIQQEYTRACLITYESLPKDGVQEGWGQPGTSYPCSACVPAQASLRDQICRYAVSDHTPGYRARDR